MVDWRTAFTKKQACDCATQPRNEKGVRNADSPILSPVPYLKRFSAAPKSVPLRLASCFVVLDVVVDMSTTRNGLCQFQNKDSMDDDDV